MGDAKAAAAAELAIPVKIKRQILGIEYMSISFTIISSIIASFSSSSPQFALSESTENLIYVLCFVIVLWRYSAEINVVSVSKDTKALTLLAVLFMLLAIFTVFDSIKSLTVGTLPLPYQSTVILYSFRAVVYFALASIKYFFSRLTTLNKVLIADCIASLIYSLMNAMLALSIYLFISNAQMWYAGPASKIVYAAVLAAYGTYLLVVNFIFPMRHQDTVQPSA